MKEYELTYIVSPELSEEELTELKNKINNFILEERGVLVNFSKPVKKKLFWADKKQNEGILNTIFFSLTPENLTNLERKIKNEKQILRYLLLKKEFKTSTQKTKKTPSLSVPPETKTEIQTELKTKEEQKIQKEQKVELKDIDKKIEEILKE